MGRTRYWIGRFLVVFGLLWLLIEPAGLFFESFSGFGWAGYITILVVSTVLTTILFWPKKRASAHFAESHTKIEVACSDILKNQGSIIISAPDTFDSEIGDIISKTSLLGKFISFEYNGDSSRADADIQKSLQGKKGREDKSKVFGKTSRYAIGTVAPIPRGETTYFLLALSKMMSKEKRVETDLKKINSALDSVWESVRNNGHHQPVHIPLVGTAYGRLGLSPMFVAQLIVLSFLLASKREQVSPSLTIHIHESMASNFDFYAIQLWLQSLTNKNG